jgi:hypothetical protein
MAMTRRERDVRAARKNISDARLLSFFQEIQDSQTLAAQPINRDL